MEIRILGADSLGVRSMATYIKTIDAKILIDPGANLAPKRFGLPPHPVEIEKLKEVWKEITRYAEKADILIITHYHFDHYNPEHNIEIYESKIVFLKHPTMKINESQMRRASAFINKIKDLAEIIEFADNREFFFNETRILFSAPVPHGIDTKLGYVLEIVIEDERGEKFLFTSDTQGFPTDKHREFVLKTRPHIIFADGPPTYLLGSRYEKTQLKQALEGFLEILTRYPVKKLIIDHHFLRDLNWYEYLVREEGFQKYFAEKVITTAAEFSKQKPNLLEARRKILWQEKSAQK
ncbi:MAG: MBL fold metallo-hydrolase [Candidatus Njordarchaeales archaeon]